MAKIIKLRGPIRRFTVAVGGGGLIRGGGDLLTICSSRVGAYSRGSFSRGGQSEDLRYLYDKSDNLCMETNHTKSNKK